MTISSSVVKSGPYSGNDVTTSFAYSFQIFADADLQVVHTDSSDVETVLTLDVDYSVSGATDPAGGSVTYPISGTPLATGEKLTIVSNLTAEQQTDLSNQGGFFPEVHETVFDKLCRMIQQVEEKLTRAVLAPISSLTLPADLYTTLIAAAASAASSAASALATWTTFDNKYLGSHASNPTTLNDGVTALDASHDGVEFWDSTLKVRKTWNGGTLTWGLTSTSAATNAVDVAIADAGGYYTGTEVEAAMQENGGFVSVSKIQTLINKTFTAPIINAPVTGTAFGRRCLVYQTAIQSLIQSSYTALTWGAEVYDTDSIHDNSTNPTRFTVPADCSLIKLYWHIRVTGSASPMYVRVHKNGGASGIPELPTIDIYSDNGILQSSFTSPPIPVTPGDYFEIKVLTINASMNTTFSGVTQTSYAGMEILT